MKRKILLITIFVILLIPLVPYLIFYNIVIVRESEIKKEWNKSFTPIEKLEKFSSSSKTNKTAKWLFKFAFKNNIYQSKEQKQKKKPDFEILKEEIQKYIKEQSEDNREHVESPPKEITDYLTKHRSEINSVESYLITKEPPEWSETDQKNHHFLIVVNLHRLFILDGFTKVTIGDMKGAEKALEASWNLLQNDRKSPILLSQLVATGLLKTEMGLIRKIKQPRDIWIERLKDQNIKALIIKAFEYDIWINYNNFVNSDIFGENLSKDEYMIVKIIWRNPYSKLIKRFISLNILNDGMLFINRIKEIDLCKDDEVTTIGWFSKYHIYSNIAYPIDLDSYLRMRKILVDIELTNKILEIKEIKMKNKYLPEHIDGIESSSCKNITWSFKRISRGGFSIECNEDIKLEPFGKIKLPLSFTSE